MWRVVLPTAWYVACRHTERLYILPSWGLWPSVWFLSLRRPPLVGRGCLSGLYNLGASPVPGMCIPFSKCWHNQLSGSRKTNRFICKCVGALLEKSWPSDKKRPWVSTLEKHKIIGSLGSEKTPHFPGALKEVPWEGSLERQASAASETWILLKNSLSLGDLSVLLSP